MAFLANADGRLVAQHALGALPDTPSSYPGPRVIEAGVTVNNSAELSFRQVKTLTGVASPKLVHSLHVFRIFICTGEDTAILR